MSDRQPLLKFLGMEQDGVVDKKQLKMLRKHHCSDRITDDDVKQVADKFNVCDDVETLELIRSCLDKNENDVVDILEDRYAEERSAEGLIEEVKTSFVDVEHNSIDITLESGDTKHKSVNVKTPPVQKAIGEGVLPVEEVSEIVCTIHKLNNHPHVDEFIENFFWKRIQRTDKDTSTKE